MQTLSSYRSWCTDMGTELGIASFSAFKLQALLPEWQQVGPMMAQGLSYDVGDDGDIGMQEPEYFMPRAVPVAGIMHMVHNLSKDLDTSLKMWSQWHSDYKKLCDFLFTKHLRELYVRTCLADTPFESQIPLFARGFGAPHWEKRWGSLVKSLQKIRSLLTVFRATWDEAKMGGDEHQDISRIVQNNVWWLYIDVLLQLHSCLHSLAGWCETCECHGHMYLGKTRRRRETALAKAFNSSKSSCPLKGKRAPQLACGDEQAFLDSLSQASMSKLMMSKCSVPPGSWGATAEDFAHDCSYIRLGLSTKLNYFKQLPWCLAGLAHPAPQKAQVVAQRCLEPVLVTHTRNVP